MIYLIRHGQTLFNAEDRVQGRIDSPLTQLGEAQAWAMGEHMAQLVRADPAGWRLEVSPLGRARQTAAIVAEAAGLPEPVVDERLIEVGYGDFEGLTRAELEARWPHFTGFESIFGRAPGGETFDHLSARVAAWLAEVEARPRSERTVAVTHAGVARTMRGLYLGLDLDAIRALDKPQGVIFRLADGSIEPIPCDVRQPGAPNGL